MKIFLIIVTTLFISVSNQTYGQVTYADTASRIVSQKFIEKHFPDGLREENYILLSVADKQYLIIVDHDKEYYGYYFNEDTTSKLKYKKITFRVKKPFQTLKNAFDENSYPKEFITMHSNFFKDKHPSFFGLRSYFYLYKHGSKFGEESIPVYVSPSPMGKRIYTYLIKTLRYYGR